MSFIISVVAMTLLGFYAFVSQHSHNLTAAEETEIALMSIQSRDTATEKSDDRLVYILLLILLWLFIRGLFITRQAQKVQIPSPETPDPTTTTSTRAPTEDSPANGPITNPPTSPEAAPTEPAPAGGPVTNPPASPETAPIEPVPAGGPVTTPPASPEAAPTEPAPADGPVTNPPSSPQAAPTEPAPSNDPTPKPADGPVTNPPSSPQVAPTEPAPATYATTKPSKPRKVPLTWSMSDSDSDSLEDDAANALFSIDEMRVIRRWLEAKKTAAANKAADESTHESPTAPGAPSADTNPATVQDSAPVITVAASTSEPPPPIPQPIASEATVERPEPQTNQTSRPTGAFNPKTANNYRPGWLESPRARYKHGQGGRNYASHARRSAGKAGFRARVEAWLDKVEPSEDTVTTEADDNHEPATATGQVADDSTLTAVAEVGGIPDTTPAATVPEQREEGPQDAESQQPIQPQTPQQSIDEGPSSSMEHQDNDGVQQTSAPDPSSMAESAPAPEPSKVPSTPSSTTSKADLSALPAATEAQASNGSAATAPAIQTPQASQPSPAPVPAPTAPGVISTNATEVVVSAEGSQTSPVHALPAPAAAFSSTPQPPRAIHSPQTSIIEDQVMEDTVDDANMANGQSFSQPAVTSSDTREVAMGGTEETSQEPDAREQAVVPVQPNAPEVQMGEDAPEVQMKDVEPEVEMGYVSTEDAQPQVPAQVPMQTPSAGPAELGGAMEDIQTTTSFPQAREQVSAPAQSNEVGSAMEGVEHDRPEAAQARAAKVHDPMALDEAVSTEAISAAAAVPVSSKVQKAMDLSYSKPAESVADALAKSFANRTVTTPGSPAAPVPTPAHQAMPAKATRVVPPPVTGKRKRHLSDDHYSNREARPAPPPPTTASPGKDQAPRFDEAGFVAEQMDEAFTADFDVMSRIQAAGSDMDAVMATLTTYARKVDARVRTETLCTSSQPLLELNAVLNYLGMTKRNGEKVSKQQGTSIFVKKKTNPAADYPLSKLTVMPEVFYLAIAGAATFLSRHLSKQNPGAQPPATSPAVKNAKPSELPLYWLAVDVRTKAAPIAEKGFEIPALKSRYWLDPQINPIIMGARDPTSIGNKAKQFFAEHIDSEDITIRRFQAIYEAREFVSTNALRKIRQDVPARIDQLRGHMFGTAIEELEGQWHVGDGPWTQNSRCMMDMWSGVNGQGEPDIPDTRIVLGVPPARKR